MAKKNKTDIPNVVIDTNVLVSGLLSAHDDSATSIILSLLYDKRLKIFY